MTRLERLYQEHALYRKKLTTLESAIAVGEPLRLVVRELCFTLTGHLQEHMRREAELIASCRTPLGAKDLMMLAEGHGAELHALHEATVVLTERSDGALRSARAPLRHAMALMEDHMHAQEYRLFPVMEWVLQASGVTEREKPMTQSQFGEDVTVNRILTLYPTTQRFFRSHFVDPLIEGSDTLEEVAWRHGLDSVEFLGELEQTVVRPHSQR